MVATGEFVDRKGLPGGTEFPVPKVRVIGPDCPPRPMEVYFLIDDSNCLLNAFLNEMPARDAIVLGVGRVMDQLAMGRDKAVVIGFGDTAQTYQTLTDDRAAILDAVRAIAMLDQSARLDLAYAETAKQLSRLHQPGTQVVTISITDGPMNAPLQLTELRAKALRDQGVKHYTIGVGDLAQYATLRTVSEPGGLREVDFGGDVISAYVELGAMAVEAARDCQPVTPTVAVHRQRNAHARGDGHPVAARAGAALALHGALRRWSRALYGRRLPVPTRWGGAVAALALLLGAVAGSGGADAQAPTAAGGADAQVPTAAAVGGPRPPVVAAAWQGGALGEDPGAGDAPLAGSAVAADYDSLAGAGAAAGTSGVAGDVQGALRYELTATWRAEPWRLKAGYFARAADVATSPDGRRVFILDSRQWAVHVLDRDGRALAVWRVPDPDPLPGADWGWVVRRMDAAPDGSLVVLLGATYRGLVVRARVQRLAADGSDLGAFERDGYHIDLAAGPDGRLYLARPYPEDPFDDGPGAVEVLDASGQLLAIMGVGVLTMPMGVDVASNGTIHVVNRVPSPSGQPPPAPTPLPSGVGPLGAGLRAGRLEAGPRQGPAPEGIALFGPDLAYGMTVPFVGAEDVGAGGSAAYVSRRGEIYRLGESAPLYSTPSGQFTSQWYGGSTFRLAVAADGALLASMNHCFHQGLAALEDVAARPATPRLHGILDRPPLEGPVFPLRLAADEGLAVLQGRFSIVGQRPDVQYFVSPEPEEPQVVQRWSADGELLGEVGLCATASAGRDLGDVWWARDVAVDGGDIFTADAEIVERHGGPPFPLWSFWPGALAAPDVPTRLVALAAHAGRLAVLDAGSRTVTVLARDGAVLWRWTTDDLPAGAVLGDLALAGDRLYLADRGRARVIVRGLDGTPVADWATADGPAALAAGPDGRRLHAGALGLGLSVRVRRQAVGRVAAAGPVPGGVGHCGRIRRAGVRAVLRAAGYSGRAGLSHRLPAGLGSVGLRTGWAGRRAGGECRRLPAGAGQDGRASGAAAGGRGDGAADGGRGVPRRRAPGPTGPGA